MTEPIVLISHPLCPYVQRAAIVLAEKNIPFERRDVDLANKPAWFLAVSPLGKTPVLLAEGEVIFESAVICEYLDDMYQPKLHPAAPIARAKHRAWMEFGSAVLNLIAGFYSAPNEALYMAKAQEIRHRFEQLEAHVGDGECFDGAFSMVDAVFAPIFRYFDVLDEVAGVEFWAGLPRLQRWRQALNQRTSVQQAVSPDYQHHLRAFLLARDSELGRRMHSNRRAVGQVNE
ncbi:glutathione S-transferase [Chitinivorax tropicus]|uniref:glutathione transferase n=1 Tax=Chitinivorax tropicus TaxID=714531 RepID=A0A840MPC9_9PROT|nr:glutathione S-transferase family protein [Chitinivorax tropicus]MBB5019315.1 glutathione S-transferase [Chitinivorax tropicus]